VSEIRSQATPARDDTKNELATAVLELLNRAAQIGTPGRAITAHVVARGLSADGWSKPRTVNSATEAEVLAEGSVILDARGEVLHWIDRGDYLQWSDIWGNECGADYPATVLFTPGGST